MKISNDEANEIADYYIDPKPNAVGSVLRNVSMFGLYNAHWIRSITAENQGNLEEAFSEHIAALACASNHTKDDAMRGLFLAAKLKDRIRFDVARQYARILPTAEVVPYVDSLDAFLLAGLDESKARQLVAKWKGKPEEAELLRHWTRQFPEVATTWKRLSSQ